MSAIGYGNVQRTFWQHPDIQGLTVNARFLAVYLLTSPHGHGIGAFQLPLAYASADTGLPAEVVSDALRELHLTGFASYCHETSVVWVRGALRYESGSGANIAKNRQKAFDSVPRRCSLRGGIAADLLDHGDSWSEEFSEKIQELAESYAEPLGSPSEAPSKPLRTHEHEHEHDLQESSDELSSSERKKLRTPEPAFLHVPLVGSVEHAITEADVIEYAEAYPGIDVRQELRALRQWNLADPKRRKKNRTGARKHITYWLTQAQNKPPGQRPAMTHANGTTHDQPKGAIATFAENAFAEAERRDAAQAAHAERGGGERPEPLEGARPGLRAVGG